MLHLVPLEYLFLLSLLSHEKSASSFGDTHFHNSSPLDMDSTHEVTIRLIL
jgi:hypothetical protein